MLKNISNLGTTLSKEEQKSISGGTFFSGPLAPRCDVPHLVFPGQTCPTGMVDPLGNGFCCPA